MFIKNSLDHFSTFIMDPCNAQYTPFIQKAAWLTTIILGIGTIGIAHVLCALWRRLRHVERNETHEKIGQIFNKIFSKNPEQQSSSVKNSTQMSQPFNQPSPVHPSSLNQPNDPPANKRPPRDPQPTHQPSPKINKPTRREASQRLPSKPLQILMQRETSKSSTTSPKDISSLPKLAQNVFDKREELWQAALKESQNHQEKTMELFIHKIENEFKKNHLSLSHISNDSAAFNIFFQSSRLRIALVNYAKINHLDIILNKHLILLAQSIYDKREDYSKQASLQSKNDPVMQLTSFTILIQLLFKSEGRSLIELFRNKEAIAIFKKSSRLMLALALFVKMNNGSKQESSQQRLGGLNPNAAAAKELGKKLGLQGQGIVSKIGLKAFESDEEQLKKGIKQYLLKNHPDKNPQADLSLIQEVGQLFNILKQGVYPDYKAALEKYLIK